MKSFLLIFCAFSLWGQIVDLPNNIPVKNIPAAVNHNITALRNAVPQKFFGTIAPGTIIGNLPGDWYYDTSAHNVYKCGAPANTAAPACTSVDVGGWEQIGAGSGNITYPGAGIPQSVGGTSWGTSLGLVTTVGSPGTDTHIATEKAIASALSGKANVGSYAPATSGSSILKGNGSGGTASATYSDIVGLFASGSCSGYLKNDGTCGSGGSGMTWPTGSGIAVYNGSAWGTSLTAPSSALVGTTDTQTLSNKTIDGVSPTTLAYVDATSSVQTQLNSKQATISGAPSTWPSLGTAASHAVADFEAALGNPSVTGYILSSTTGGSRSWIAPAAGGGSMTWPAAAGVAVYGGSSAWGSSLPVGTGANNLVQLDTSAHLPAVDGSALTGVVASGVAGPSGTAVLVEGAEGAKPTAPASGSGNIWFDSTNHLPQYQGSAGTIIGTMVVPAAARTVHQFATHIPSTGSAGTAAIDNSDLPTAALSGVLIYTAGVPAAIGTSATNCVHEDGSSGGCVASVPVAYTVTTDTTTARTLSSGDNASVISFTSSSPITLTVPSGLGAGFNAIVEQAGAGVVSLTGSGATLHQLAGSAATAGQWAKVGIYATTDTSWQLTGELAGTSGFANPMTGVGDMIRGGASGAPTALAADTSNTRKFLREQSTGGSPNAPAWDTLQSGDIPNNAANTSGTAADLSATLSIAHGGTAQTSVPGSSGNYVYNNGGAYGAKALTQTHAIGCGVGDPPGSALATGVLCYVVAAAACTIQSWDILVDAGTATVDVWKVASGTAVPTVSNSIVSSAAPAISTGTSLHSTTLTGWTTAVEQYDRIGFNLTTTSGPKYIYVGVNCDESK